MVVIYSDLNFSLHAVGRHSIVYLSLVIHKSQPQVFGLNFSFFFDHLYVSSLLITSSLKGFLQKMFPKGLDSSKFLIIKVVSIRISNSDSFGVKKVIKN